MPLDATSPGARHEAIVDSRKPVALGWSGGKDSALTLHALPGD